MIFKKLSLKMWVVLFITTILMLSFLVFTTFIYVKASLLEMELKDTNGSRFFEDSINDNFFFVKKPPELKKLAVRKVPPKSIVKVAKGHYIVTFDKAFFGTLSINNKRNEKLIIKLYETSKKDYNKLADNEINNYVGFYGSEFVFSGINSHEIISLPHRHKPSVDELPSKINSIMPFKEVELIGYQGELTSNDIIQLAVHYPFDEESFLFQSDNLDLNRVVELSRHTAIATTYASLFVDGDRERLPYEADAYIQFLSNAVMSNDYSIAKYTLNYLLSNSTWPTEWQIQTIYFAHAYYMYSGDKETILKIFPLLEKKLLTPLVDNNGLLSSSSELQTNEFLKSLNVNSELKDIVDWPASERNDFLLVESNNYFVKTIKYWLKLARHSVISAFDFPLAKNEYKNDLERANLARFVIPSGNSVVNMYRYHALLKLSQLACFIDISDKCISYKKQADELYHIINEYYFDIEFGLYSDVPKSKKHSFHSNLFSLSFDLAPAPSRANIASFLSTKGMACSVYGAQFLLEGLFKIGADVNALKLITNRTERGWLHMIDSLGSTMTAEAWNFNVKPNMDLNHGWGTSPVNLSVRYLAGIRPLKPGFQHFIVQPQLASLNKLVVNTPTIHGVIKLKIEKLNEIITSIELLVPEGTTADFVFPVNEKSHFVIFESEKQILESGGVTLQNVRPGKYAYTIKKVE